MQRPLPWLDEDSLTFPDPATALEVPNGLLAVGGDLRPERLLQAYRNGIFPWFDQNQPPLWWSPDPRMVLFPAELHVSRSLQRCGRKTAFTFSSDRVFNAVVQACAGPRPGATGTWITEGMAAAYQQLHVRGYAHSVEVWDGSKLVGGLYGVALGGMFFGESMFSHATNASKLALVYLVKALQPAGYQLIDCQVASTHLASLGARTIPRREFMEYLPPGRDVPKPPIWPVQ